MKILGSDGSWCRDEFEAIDLGDKRLNKRFIWTAMQISEQPLASINQACSAWEDTKGAYRLFSNERCTAEEIKKVHASKTLARIQGHRRVLVIQDSTTLNFNNHIATEGLGKIGRRASTREQSQGLWMHSALAVLPHKSSNERDGVPLGLLDQKIWARPQKKKTRKATGIPIEKKESFKWIEALQNTHAQAPSGTEFVTVCDREGDIFEFMHFAQDIGAKFLIRNNGDRRLWPDIRWKVNGHWGVKPGNTLRNHLLKQPNSEILTIKVPRKAGLYPQREAKVEVRFGEVYLHSPTWPAELTSISPKMEPVRVHAIWVQEINPPQEILNPDPKTLAEQRKKSPRLRRINRGKNPSPPLEWMLLTNVEVKTLDDALERVRWYEQRWQIECFHKVLKSGCAVERCRLQHAERLEKYLVLNSVIAWKIHWISLVSRRTPNTPATYFLTTSEWQALYCKINKTRKPPKKPPTVYQTVRWLAQLGGFLGRKSDGEPGTTTLWRGWQRLHDIAEDWVIFR